MSFSLEKKKTRYMHVIAYGYETKEVKTNGKLYPHSPGYVTSPGSFYSRKQLGLNSHLGQQ